MKRIFILVFASYHFALSFCQDSIYIYYNSNWQEVKPVDTFSYYRKLNKSDNLWFVRDYYSNGDIQMTGSFKNKSCTKKEGDFKYYYFSGLTKSEGKFSNNKKVGHWINYYENGNKDVESDFFYDKYDGQRKWYFENGQLAAEETYKNNERMNATFWDSLGVEIDISEAERNANFQNGDLEKFRMWVMQNINYPQQAIEKGISGKVVIGFNVDKHGNVVDLKIIKGVHKLLDTEAINTIKNSPKWNPAKAHNRFAKQQFVIPVVFGFL